MLTKVSGTTQVLTSSAVAANSAVLTGPGKVRIATTQAIYVAIGANAVATGNDFIIGSNWAEHFKYADGDRVSVLQVASPGNVSVTIVA